MSLIDHIKVKDIRAAPRIKKPAEPELAIPK
jgi:hypothetical protein